MAVFNFDGEVAKIVGVNGAVLFWNIAYWIEKNRANKKHFQDGRYWTYNSMKAFEELFPFMTTKQVRNALDKLIDAELVITGDYNKKGFDKTKWYALTTYGEDLSKGQKDLPKTANASAQKGKPIPDINTDNKPNKEKELDTNVSNSKKKGFTPPSLEEVKAYVTEQGYHFDANQFYQYYAVDNWHKADGTPVKNWKRCCITWESKADKTSSVPQSKSIYETL